MVSSLAKNATKPNPFEIIVLQTTRKENNWKTEETLVESSCNFGDGTDQRVQSLLFMMMMMMTMSDMRLYEHGTYNFDISYTTLKHSYKN